MHGTKLAVIYDPIIQRTYVAVTENNVEVTGTYDNGTMNKAPVMVQEGSFAHVQSPIVSSKNASSTENLLGTVTVGKNEEVPEIKEFISKNSTLDVRYDAAPLVGKKEFIEKAIDSLKEEAPKELPTEVTIKTFNEPNKKEPVASKAVPTLTSTASPYDTPSKKTAAVLVSSSSETQPPASGGGGFTVVPVEVVTKQLKSFTLNDTLSQEEQSFSDAFYTTYEQLYFVDDPITYCKRLGQMSAKSMVSSLTTITEQAGYILPKQDELVSFATDLVAACADESMNNKAQNFKIRFDTAYPY